MMENTVTGMVTKVQRMSIHDGPGIRTTLFLKGCNFRCRWCHNPETWRREAQIERIAERCIACGACVPVCRSGALRSEEGGIVLDRERCDSCGLCVSVCPARAMHLVGREVSAEGLMRELRRDMPYFEESGGGVTLSGGDPLFQPDFTGAVLKGCRKLGLHTCLDTSGHLGVNAGEEMLADTDLVLLDIKAWNPERYRSLTGGELRPTLEFAERLASLRKPVWLRYVLVPGVTDNLEEIEGLSRHAALLGNVERVDVLPFHQMGRFKWDELKLDYTLKGTPEASAKLAEQVRGIFRREGFPDCVH